VFELDEESTGEISRELLEEFEQEVDRNNLDWEFKDTALCQQTKNFSRILEKAMTNNEEYAMNVISENIQEILKIYISMI
jgi:hypothetical protein